MPLSPEITNPDKTATLWEKLENSTSDILHNNLIIKEESGQDTRDYTYFAV